MSWRKKNAMNDRQLVLSKFEFLIYMDFQLIDSYDYVSLFAFFYRKGNIILRSSYEWLEKTDFRVGIRDTNNEENSRFTDILNTGIGSTEEKEMLVKSVDDLLRRKNPKRKISQEMLGEIIDLYVVFVKNNIHEIQNWKYDSV